MQTVEPDRIAIAGGGAAGFFAAIACAKARPGNEVRIFERGSHFLAKVRISGGGRCNVTHMPLDVRAFCSRYPRGDRALPGALHRFDAADTIAWFEQHNVQLKTENDGRMFPVTDSSETVIDCLLRAAEAAGVVLRPRTGVEHATRRVDGGFELRLSNGERTTCDRLLLATGGARTPGGPAIAQSLGHSLEPPVPSLFSLHLDAPWLLTLPGVAVQDAEVSAPEWKLRGRGPLLITHNGVSGPAVLRFSAWGARQTAACGYRFLLRLNWMPALTGRDIAEEFQRRRIDQPNRTVVAAPLGGIPGRLWEQLVLYAGVRPETQWTRLSRIDAENLIAALQRTELPVVGKSLNKDEFVTCGGIPLREVDLRSMESRIAPRLYFAGELLDIDGITGGFNFQAAWTTGWIAGHAMADKVSTVSPRSGQK